MFHGFITDVYVLARSYVHWDRNGRSNRPYTELDDTATEIEVDEICSNSVEGNGEEVVIQASSTLTLITCSKCDRS